MPLKICLEILCFVLINYSTVSGSWSNCTKLDYNEKAFIGWPILVPCSAIYTNDLEFYDYFYYYDNKENFGDCRVWDNGKLVYNITDTLENLFAKQNKYGFLIVDLQNTTSKNFVIEVQFHGNVRCLTMNFSINAIPFLQESCHEFVDRKSIVYNNLFNPTDIGNSMFPHCKPSGPPSILPMENLQYEWLRNCSRFPENANSTIMSKDFALHNINYNDAGLYTCSVTYNGMTRYLLLLPICVATPQDNHRPTLSCTFSEVQGTIGKEFGVTCIATFGKGTLLKNKDQLALYRVGWHKVNPKKKKLTLCKFSSKERISCTLVIESNNPTCSLGFSPESESNATVRIIFKIKNITNEDFGNYYFEIEKLNDDAFSASQLILFSKNVKPTLSRRQTLLLACIFLLITAFVLVLLISLYGKLYLKVIYKRYFGNFEEGNKKYGAYFLYHYSQSFDKFAQQSLRINVIAFRDLLENMGYIVYDQYKDGFNYADRTENTKKSIEESYRIVIFLSHEFIKDDWSVLALQEGFYDMITKDSRIVFLLFPGIKEYLLQNEEKDQSCRVISEALKLNYTINCEKNMKKLRFKFAVEDAMPKLRAYAKNKNRKYFKGRQKTTIDVKNIKIIA